MKKLPALTPDTPTISELIECLSTLKSDSKPRWGKMSSTQMCKHVDNFNKLYFGELQAPFAIRILARSIGSVFLKKILSKSPLETPKNMNTLPIIKVEKTDLEFESTKQNLIDSLEKSEELNGSINHQMYGEMLAEDVIALIRHHATHHFNQFGLLKRSQDQ